jgi:hypothetical protein
VAAREKERKRGEREVRSDETKMFIKKKERTKKGKKQIVTVNGLISADRRI